MPTRVSKGVSAPRGARWSAGRRCALVLRLLSGKITVREAAKRHDLPIVKIEEWRRRFLEGGETALRSKRSPATRREPNATRRLEAILDNTTAVIYVKDLDGRYALINRQFERIFNVERETFLGRTDYDLFASASAVARFRENDGKVIAAGAPVEFEEIVPHDDGLHTYISIKFPLVDTEGKPNALCGISTDITERKRTEERLQQVTAELRAFYQAQPDLAFKLAGDGTILDYKSGQSSALYVPPAQFLGRRMIEVLPPEASRLLAEALTRIQAPGMELVTTEYALPMPDGREHYFEARLTRLADGQVLVLVRDISARKRAEESLTLLARRLVTVRDEERERLGFDLHDGVCQELAGIGILIAAAHLPLGSVVPEAAARLDRAGQHLQSVIEHLRVRAHELRPMLLHDLGLEESLRALASGLAMPPCHVVTNFARDLPRLDESTEIAIYRLAQEALTNAVRHAEARLVTLTLAAHGETLRLVVQDDGRGFDIGNGGVAALGIASMEQRALALGARFDLRSELGKGTTVTIECPLRLRHEPRPRQDR